MRVAQIALAATLAAGPSALAAPSQAPEPTPAQPVFRTGVERLTIDVTAVDAAGRQVRDLRADELTVEVDGRPRTVVSAEYVRLVPEGRARPRATLRPAVTAAPAYYVANTGTSAPGRLVLLIVDQGNIRIGGGRRATEEARRFVDRLQPEDRVGVALIPAPGTLLDFTTDHARVKEALTRALGTADPPRSRFNLSPTEARALVRRTNARVAEEALARECGVSLSVVDREGCGREMMRDAADMVAAFEWQAEQSVRVMRGLLEVLAGIDARKQVVLVSEGLVADDMGGSIEDLSTLAADARASIDVLMLDSPRGTAPEPFRARTAREDRAARVEGLEQLAAASRGSFYRVGTSAAAAFARIERALEGYYLVALEALPEDRDGVRRRIAVSTSRPDVTLRTHPVIPAAPSTATATADEAVTRALESPVLARELPLRLAAWRFKEAGSTRHRVLVVVEADRWAGQSLEYTTGLALFGRDGSGHGPPVSRQTLEEGPEPGQARFVTRLMVDPGVYRLRVAMADSQGRLGSVEWPLDVFYVDGSAPAAGDLALSGLPGDPTTPVGPAIEPLVAGASIAAVTEAYLPEGTKRDALTAVVAITRTEQAATILEVPMQALPPSTPEPGDVVALQAVIDTSTLAPGRYLARARVSLSGRTISMAMRPFHVDAGSSTTTTAPAAATVVDTTIPAAVAEGVVDGLPAFTTADLFAPALMSFTLKQAAARGDAVTEAIDTARAGDFGAAATAALVSGDQALAAFLKGLDLLEQGDEARAAIQLQSAMTQAPTFVPARVFFGAALAASRRHRDAAGLLQSGATADGPAVLARLAGEEWLRAGEFDRAIGPLAHAAARPDAGIRAQRALGLAYVMADQPAKGLDVLRPYLARQADDRAALLAGLFALYARHARGDGGGPTLADDRALAERWLRAYHKAGGTLPLPAGWVSYLTALH